MAARHLKARPVADQRLLSLLAVHESYVAAAEVTWPSLGKLTVVSMHASPATVPSDDLAGTRVARRLLGVAAPTPVRAAGSSTATCC